MAWASLINRKVARLNSKWNSFVESSVRVNKEEHGNPVPAYFHSSEFTQELDDLQEYINTAYELKPHLHD